jgi:hypothetical protein
VGLEKIFESLGKVAGVNILFDEGFRDKKASVNLTNVSFEEALDRIAFVNRLFYKVLDQNTVIIVPDSAAKRRCTTTCCCARSTSRTGTSRRSRPWSDHAGAAGQGGPTPPWARSTSGHARRAVGGRASSSPTTRRAARIVQVEIMEVNRTLKQYASRSPTTTPRSRGSHPGSR